MKKKKLIIFGVIIVLVLVLNQVFGLGDLLLKGMDSLGELVEQNFLMAVLLYIVLTIVGCVVLALPGVTFAIAAGLLFGPFWGTISCSIATTIGAMFAFIAGRFFLKDSMEPLVKKNKYIKKWLFDESGKNEIFILMITRLVPLFPYNLQNFAYGITDISFVSYSVCSLLFMLPGTAMYTVGTAGIADAEHRWLYIGIAIVLAIVVMGIGMILKKKYFSVEGEEIHE